MITLVDNLPPNMVGFKATGNVTEEDFTNVVMPKVKEAIEKNNELNYLLILETPIKNFTMGAWLQDAVMGLKHLFKWRRAAIVTDEEGIKTFTGIFSMVMPGEFKAFEHKDLQTAIYWAAEVSDK